MAESEIVKYNHGGTVCAHMNYVGN